VLEEFSLPSFSERSLYRVFEILGANRDKINIDWTSIVLHGNEARLGKYGYSMDHRPDKKQITVGVTELSGLIDIQIGMTIEPGNLNFQTHLKKKYWESSNRLREGSLVIFDKGANSVTNTQMIWAENLQYINGKKLNKSNEKIIAKFETCNPHVIDEESGIRGIKIDKLNSINYLDF